VIDVKIQVFNGIRRLQPVGVEDFLCGNLRHHHPRQFRIEPTNAVGANDKISWIENVTFNEIKNRSINPRSLWLH
jgi:hypothetical protein